MSSYTCHQCCTDVVILYSNIHLFEFEKLNQNDNSFEKECNTMQINLINLVKNLKIPGRGSHIFIAILLKILKLFNLTTVVIT